jgi:tRNA threonylcarbamoyladenosine biosynthesis protein TsaB
MMRILGIEGALARCSAAVVAGDAVLAAEARDAERGHPSLLPPMTAAVLARAGGCDAVAVGVGPGGFTGLRAAIALAEGIARAAGVPLVGVTTGEALAAALPEGSRTGRAVWSAIGHRCGRVVLEILAPGAACPAPPCVASLAALPEATGPVVVVGDAAHAVAAALAARGGTAEARPSLPDAAALARVAARRLAGELPWRDATPVYGEPPAVRLPA